MSDQFDDLDRRLRSIAHAARQEAAVGPADTEQALAEVTSGAQLARLRPVANPRPGRRWQPWIAVAAATALILTGGIWLLTRGDDQVRSVDPTIPAPAVSTSPSSSPSEVVTVPPTPPSETVTTSPTTPVSGGPTLIQRSCYGDGDMCTRLYADPSDASLAVFACDPVSSLVSVYADAWRTVQLPRCPMLVGPGPVAYLTEETGAESVDLVAVSLAAGDAGTELQRWPSAIDPSGDTEYVAAPAGIVAVGCCGAGMVADMGAGPQFEWVLPSGVTAVDGFSVAMFDPDGPAIVVGDARWRLDDVLTELAVRGAPMMVATDDGGAIAVIFNMLDQNYTLVYARAEGDVRVRSLGNATEAGFDDTALPALLHRSGTVLIPDGDAFAWVDIGSLVDDGAPEVPPPTEPTAPPTTAAPTDPAVPPPNDALLAGLYYEGAGIGNACVPDGVCTQVVFDPSGAAVSYDPATRAVTWHGREGASTPFVVPGTRPASLLAAGPDRVVYIRVASDDPELENVAAHSAGPGDQWREIRAYPGVLGIGDYDVVPSPDGLVTVGWYGQGLQPESPEPVIEWIGRDGQPVTSPQPLVRMNYYEIAVEIGDRTWSFTDPVEGAHPSRPPITPTFDGGFLAVLHHGADGSSAVVRGWSDGTVDTWYPPAEAGAWINVIPEPSGFVLVPHGDTFMRAELFPTRTDDYWDGERSIDFEAGTMTAVGLNESLDANEPWWETDPVGFANAVAGPVSSPAERRTIEFRDEAVVVTTENHLDDSVYGTRLTFHLVAGEGGPRVDRIDWANTCQPGRGHQDYQAALCA